jgi:hypothetical protein
MKSPKHTAFTCGEIVTDDCPTITAARSVPATLPSWKNPTFTRPIR